jgi:hypothetical protein
MKKLRTLPVVAGVAVVSVALLCFAIVVAQEIVSAQGADDAPPPRGADSPRDSIADKVRELPADPNAKKQQSIIAVYPVPSIEEWEDTLPRARVGQPDKNRIQDNRDLLLRTHYPYRDDKDERLATVNFQREMHKLLDRGAKLMWMDGRHAYFTTEDVAMTPEQRIGRDVTAQGWPKR